MARIFAFVLMVILCFGTLPALGGDKAFEVFQFGLKQEERLRIFEAQDTFREAIRLDPDNFGYREHYAWFLHIYEFPEEAVSLFRSLLPKARERGVLLRGLGWNEWQLGRNAAALEAYQQIFSLPKVDGDYRPAFDKVKRLLSEENLAVIRDLREKLARQPDDHSLQRKLLQGYLDAGMPSEALALANALLLENPDDLFVQLSRVRALAWSGRQSESEEALQGLINDDLNNAYLLYILGRLQHTEKRLPESAANLRRSLAFYDRAAVTRKELAEVLATQGRFGEAMEVTEGIGRTPENTLVLLLARSRSAHFSGRLEQAGLLYREVLASYPQNRDAMWGLAETSTYAGHFASAERTMEHWQLAATADDRYEIQRQLLSAYSRPTLGVRTDYYDNSSDFSRINAGVDGRVHLGRGVTLIPAYVFSNFHQTGFSDISRNAFSLSTEYRPGDFISASAGLGVSLYDTDQQRLTSKESITVRPTRGFEVGISHRHLEIIDNEPIFGNPIYNYVVTLGAVGRTISSDDFALDLSLLPRHDLTVWGRFIYGDYSDHNRKLSRILGIDHRPSSIPGLRFSYNYFFLDYADPAPLYTENNASVAAYYDPINLEVHSLSAAYDLDITETLRAGGQVNISHLPKGNGLANALFGYVSLKLSRAHSIRLDGRYFYQDKGVDRTGTSGSFSARNVMLAYEYTF